MPLETQKVKDLRKRLDHLDKLLMQKKNLVDNEMFQIQNLCKEIIKINEQIDILEGKKEE